MGILVALAVAGPLVALPASFLVSGEMFDQIAQTLLPQALTKSVLLGVGVTAGTLVLGAALPVFVSCYDFPGRRWLDWGWLLIVHQGRKFWLHPGEWRNPVTDVAVVSAINERTAGDRPVWYARERIE